MDERATSPVGQSARNGEIRHGELIARSLAVCRLINESANPNTDIFAWHYESM